MGYLLSDLPPLKEVLDGLQSAISYLVTSQPTLGQFLELPTSRDLLNPQQLHAYVSARIEGGADVNDVSHHGHRSLTLALRYDLPEVALLLIQSGADTQTRDKSGFSGFEWALQRQHYDLAHEMHRLGHPYSPYHPNSNLKVSEDNLVAFNERLLT